MLHERESRARQRVSCHIISTSTIEDEKREYRTNVHNSFQPKLLHGRNMARLREGTAIYATHHFSKFVRKIWFVFKG